MIQHLGNQNKLRGTFLIDRPATFVDSSDCGMSESLMLADENFNSPNSINTLLGVKVFFEFRRQDKKNRLQNYPVLRGRYFQQRLKEFQGKDSSFPIMKTQISNCRDFGNLRNCLIRNGKLKFCVQNTSRNLPHKMKRNVTL